MKYTQSISNIKKKYIDTNCCVRVNVILYMCVFGSALMYNKLLATFFCCRFKYPVLWCLRRWFYFIFLWVSSPLHLTIHFVVAFRKNIICAEMKAVNLDGKFPFQRFCFRYGFFLALFCCCLFRCWNTFICYKYLFGSWPFFF